MTNLLKSDFYKLFRSKYFYICNIILLAFVVITLITSIVMKTSIEKLGNDLEDFTHFTDFLNGIHSFPVFFSLSSTIFLLVAIIISNFVTLEFSQGTIKNIISIGHPREYVYLSKLLTMLFSALHIVLSSLIFMVLSYTIAFGFGKIPENFYPELIRMLLLEFLVIFSVVSFFLMLAFLYRKNSSAISTSIIIIFLSPIVFSLINALGNYYFKFKEFQSEKYLMISYSDIFADYKIEQKDIITGIIVCILTIIITTAIGMFTFKKRDIN